MQLPDKELCIGILQFLQYLSVAHSCSTGGFEQLLPATASAQSHKLIDYANSRSEDFRTVVKTGSVCRLPQKGHLQKTNCGSIERTDDDFVDVLASQHG